MTTKRFKMIKTCLKKKTQELSKNGKKKKKKCDQNNYKIISYLIRLKTCPKSLKTGTNNMFF